jgi:hypothetical protein
MRKIDGEVSSDPGLAGQSIAAAGEMLGQGRRRLGLEGTIEYLDHAIAAGTLASAGGADGQIGFAYRIQKVRTRGDSDAGIEWEKPHHKPVTGLLALFSLHLHTPPVAVSA